MEKALDLLLCQIYIANSTLACSRPYSCTRCFTLSLCLKFRPPHFLNPVTGHIRTGHDFSQQESIIPTFTALIDSTSVTILATTRVHVINVSLPGIIQQTVSIFTNSASVAFPATTCLHLFTMLVKTLLLLYLGAVSKALKPGDHPWIGSFDIEDVTCTNTTLFDNSDNSDAPGRPEVGIGSCAPFERFGDRVGGIWGTHDRQISSMYVHVATDCTGNAQVTITREPKGEAGFCIPVADLGGGDFAWNAVQGG